MNRAVRITSTVIVVVGVALLAVNIATQGQVNVALPLVFLLLGGGFAVAALALRARYRWLAWLWTAAALMLSLGSVFLLNVVTQDWDAWAYAWLLILASLGAGTALAARDFDSGSPPGGWSQIVQLAGWVTAAAGLVFFAIFGAIAGGVFIQVMAAVLVIAGGLSLRFVPWDAILPASLLQRLGVAPRVTTALPASAPTTQTEPLSARELEVLALVEAGLSNQQIAARLNIAASTVKTHINNLYGKLGAQTRTQAVRRARELGLLH